ncbi:hypothetical protein [Leptotrichia buccalis]|uniref:Uncharacterized protein n=1 Tax=Leptotrichia buccalis (strain ATCC 14201 / DSM 1135 / JCM 12969 / NCTC 10249 / C-1013-b) TaxID=523794 RepID=C7N9U4_LEPBD|nr:hypothetical protein [Leptotrichia buccalis]ACV38925.1 hypothetical protein Lebu_1025 [Leptotrichia buccalis C-1013-b]
MSKEIKDNWYVVLGLDFYPDAEENEEKIKQKIEEKKVEWERRKVRALNKEDFIRYINSYDTIKKEMLGDNNIRKELIKDAITPVDNALKMGEGSIKVFTDDIIKKISRETKRSEKIVRERIMENPNFELYDKTIYNDYLDIIKKRADFEVIEKSLKILNNKDIYSFLNSQNLKFETLNNNIIIKERKKLTNLHNDISSAKNKLYNQIENMINNNEEKQKYDKYLKYNEVMKELNYVKIYKNKTVGMKTVHNIKKILENEKEAINIFIGFCEENNIAYNLSDNSDTEIEDTLNDEAENLKLTSDNKRTSYLIRFIVALIVLTLGVFIINTYFIGI